MKAKTTFTTAAEGGIPLWSGDAQAQRTRRRIAVQVIRALRSVFDMEDMAREFLQRYVKDYEAGVGGQLEFRPGHDTGWPAQRLPAGEWPAKMEVNGRGRTP
jgi:hypothetical protein